MSGNPLHLLEIPDRGFGVDRPATRWLRRALDYGRSNFLLKIFASIAGEWRQNEIQIDYQE
ncbi:MAG: hypothetical protein WBL95_04595 [Microcoleus sp.]